MSRDLIVPIVLDACNPGPMTGAGNNTYLLASQGAALLIDAGIGHPDHLTSIRRALEDTDAVLTQVVVTHGHADHVAGAAALAQAHPLARFSKYLLADEPDHGVAWTPLADGSDVSAGATSLRVVHTPGHAPDHLAFWHERAGAIFTGDLVVAGGSVTIGASRGGNLQQYLHSLDRLLQLDPVLLLPAHGPRIDNPSALLRAAIEHRAMRERQVTAALDAGHRTVEAIADYIYHGLDHRLLGAARENVRAHLQKLASDGVAVERDGWRRR